MKVQAIARQAQEEHDRATLAETRREWEALGREIDRKEREIEQLRESVREMAKQRGELSRLGAQLIEKVGGN